MWNRSMIAAVQNVHLYSPLALYAHREPLAMCGAGTALLPSLFTASLVLTLVAAPLVGTLLNRPAVSRWCNAALQYGCE